MKKGKDKKTVTEAADRYIKKVEEEIRNCSAHEKNGILLEKVRYWYWSAIDWRNSYEEKIDMCLKTLGKGTNE